jgi:hypothetical protein
MGFLASYQTNEVNIIASLVAWFLAQLTISATPLKPRQRILASGITMAVGVAFLTLHVPLLLLWMLTGVFKLLFIRDWRLLIPMIVAIALPYGGGLGGPMYALFAIILAVYVTPLGWIAMEDKLRTFGPAYACSVVLLFFVTVGLLRTGETLPVVSKLAKPLFVERERTYQLEQTLSWLASSKYCSYDIGFTMQGADPVNDVENAITRQYRPPTTIGDVGLFWNTVLRCNANGAHRDQIVTITFGQEQLADGKNIFELPGTNAGPIKAWIRYQ